MHVHYFKVCMYFISFISFMSLKLDGADFIQKFSKQFYSFFSDCNRAAAITRKTWWKTKQNKLWIALLKLEPRWKSLFFLFLFILGFCVYNKKKIIFTNYRKCVLQNFFYTLKIYKKKSTVNKTFSR